jgi:AbiU2
MPSQVEKLQAHASLLLDAFIRLRERYAMLEPMLFDPDVPKLRGSGNQGRGFLILRQSLFLSCAQDIAKLTLDSDKRTPSIKSLMSALQDVHLCTGLREAFSIWTSPSIETETDPEILEALRRMESREQLERALQFDEIQTRARANWETLSQEPYLAGFLTIRDKVAAHTEVQLIADKYQFVDIGTLGMKWSDMRSAINSMQTIVEDLGLVIRNVGFAWEMLDTQLAKASKAFWSAPEGAA